MVNRLMLDLKNVPMGGGRGEWSDAGREDLREFICWMRWSGEGWLIVVS